MPELRHIVLQWPRLGPYHLARLAALGRAADARGVRVSVIEAARREAVYADVREETAHEGFERVTLFPEDTFETIAPRAVRAAVRDALDRLQPDAIGVNSYSLPDALATLEWARQNRRVAVGMTDTKADDGPRSRWREALKARIVRQFDAMLVSGTASQLRARARRRRPGAHRLRCRGQWFLRAGRRRRPRRDDRRRVSRASLRYRLALHRRQEPAAPPRRYARYMALWPRRAGRRGRSCSSATGRGP